MDKARYLVEAHVVEGRSVSELAAAHGVHRSWIYKLLARYKVWQADVTHWRLAGAGHMEILNVLDDHSRLFLASRAYPTVKAADVVDVFRMAIALHGAPSSLLCDNGAVFTAAPRGGKVLLQTELERLGIAAKNSRPYHPQTCGKVERLHQTLKRWLARQAPVRTLAGLQEQLDGFTGYYNARRPHRALGGRSAGARPCRPTALGSRPGHSVRPQRTPISASARTRSTPMAPSPCAITAGCITSASAGPTRAVRSSSSSQIATSASWPSTQAS